LLVTVRPNNGLKFEIGIVHDLSCHPISPRLAERGETLLR